MSIETDLRAAADKATADSLLLHQIVHGDVETTVSTEGGPVKTIAKAINDVEASVAASTATITQAVGDAEASRAAAELARDQAVDARDDALGAVGTVAVSETDATPAGLASKVEVGLGLETTISNTGGDERLAISVTPQVHASALVALARGFI